MDDLNAAKDELAVQQAELETQRAESDELLIQMAKEYESMSAEYADYEAMEDELSAQIAKSETDYFNALSREQAAAIAGSGSAEAEQRLVRRTEFQRLRVPAGPTRPRSPTPTATASIR